MYAINTKVCSAKIIVRTIALSLYLPPPPYLMQRIMLLH